MSSAAWTAGQTEVVAPFSHVKKVGILVGSILATWAVLGAAAWMIVSLLD